MKASIPNLLTLGNLCCGLLGIIWAFEGNLMWASLVVLPALVFDFLDGFVARLLKVASPMGKELDSLADLVTFGVLPGILMFHLLIGATCDPKVCTGLIASHYFPYLGLLLPLSAAWRLAKFNTDVRQSDQFFGVPTPAATMMVISLPLMMEYQPGLFPWLFAPKVLAGLNFIIAYLMVADFPLLALKFKNFRFRENLSRYLLLLGGVFSLIVFQFAGILIMVVWYIVLSLVVEQRKKRQAK